MSTATATVSVKFIGFQCALLVTGLVFWLAHWDMAAEQLAGMRYLVALGYLVNSALMVGVALTMVRSRWVNRVVSWCVRQLAGCISSRTRMPPATGLWSCWRNTGRR